jgi:hypothetical protein
MWISIQTYIVSGEGLTVNCIHTANPAHLILSQTLSAGNTDFRFIRYVFGLCRFTYADGGNGGAKRYHIPALLPSLNIGTCRNILSAKIFHKWDVFAKSFLSSISTHPRHGIRSLRRARKNYSGENGNIHPASAIMPFARTHIGSADAPSLPSFL